MEPSPLLWSRRAWAREGRGPTQGYTEVNAGLDLNLEICADSRTCHAPLAVKLS